MKQRTLFGEDYGHTRNKDKKRTRKEIDASLNSYFSGTADPKRMGRQEGRTLDGTAKFIGHYRTNEKSRPNDLGRAALYRPGPTREWRGGKRWTQNDLKFLEAHIQHGCKIVWTSRLMQRSKAELKVKACEIISGRVCRDPVEYEGMEKDREQELTDEEPIDRVAQHKEMKGAVFSLDLLWAYAYCYHVSKQPVITDKEYDILRAEEMEFGTLHNGMIAGKKVVDYPPHIRELACYLMAKHNTE